ncbi:MAG: hypothetical protein JW815_02520 [Candidatus Bathyarchaeota archaeon]|nr:hypothetical protein [Candidatus Bathyarchaeum sp.]
MKLNFVLIGLIGLIIGLAVILVSSYEMSIGEEWGYAGIALVIIGFLALFWGLLSQDKSADVGAHKREPYMSKSPSPI